MVFAIEIRLIHSKGVDKMLDLLAEIGAQLREVSRERRRAGCSNPVQHATLDIISLCLCKNDAGMAIEELAKAAKFLLAGRQYGCHAGADRDGRPFSPTCWIASWMA